MELKIAAIAILIPATIAFVVGLAISPFISAFLYKYKLWKRKPRSVENTDAMSSLYKQVDNHENEIKTPRVGGVLIWLAVALTMLLGWVLQYVSEDRTGFILDFTSRAQTLIPFAVFIVAACIGLIDDLLQVLPRIAMDLAHGFTGAQFVSIVGLFGLVGGWWFYEKLAMTSIHIPVVGDVGVGWWIIPIFMIVAWAVFSSGVIDGVDGLASGVLVIVYAAYATIAFSQSQFDLSAFCLVISGATLAFLWFNIPPARFYLGETGMFPLTMTLTYVAFLTNTVLLLPIIAFPLFVTALSSFVQIIAKKMFNTKIFLVAPVHHHFEALGWSRPKITMRYWIVSIMFAGVGVIVALIS